MESYPDNAFYLWAITLKEENGDPIGSIAAVDRNDELAKVQIGYCIGKKYWRRGIASEALKAVIEYFFTTVGVNRIEARHDPRNPHSGMVMKKCGMKCEGTVKAADRNNQGVCDATWYAISKSQFDPDIRLRSSAASSDF